MVTVRNFLQKQCFQKSEYEFLPTSFYASSSSFSLCRRTFGKVSKKRKDFAHTLFKKSKLLARWTLKIIASEF